MLKTRRFLFTPLLITCIAALSQVLVVANAQETQEPVTELLVKPGRCTPMKLNKLSLCHQRYDLCQEDVQCPGDYKCCPRPCGHVCQAPLNETQSAVIKMTSAASRPSSPVLQQVFAPAEDYARDLIATFQNPTKKTIDPYSYYYNQMTKSRNWQDLLNLYQGRAGYQGRGSGYNAAYSPSRMQLLNAQRYMPYNNMVMRTKSYNPNHRKNPLAEKISKLSQRRRGQVAAAGASKSKECDCESKSTESSGSNRLQTLSSRLGKKTRPEKLTDTQLQEALESAETLSMTSQQVASDPLEEALNEQEPVAETRQEPAEPGIFKAGVCPNKFTFGRCLIECYQDSECPGNQICCHSGCGYSCAIPVSEKLVAGQCPNNKNRIFKCSAPKPSCMRDRDCGFAEKCCSIGCQFTCMKV